MIGIASPDHWHAVLCRAAMQVGKHVYCERPLTHTVEEARQVAEMAKRSQVVTQTGNQGIGSSNFRRSIEMNGECERSTFECSRR
ncbi:MAG: Gfo/Idh/MocA family oxidoreductase [Verrucomicrobia bacterium]|nr:Gfo/Idh/MocA family oxidoreductase [Verrucomicrobiota bacterium]